VGLCEEVWKYSVSKSSAGVAVGATIPGLRRATLSVLEDLLGVAALIKLSRAVLEGVRVGAVVLRTTPVRMCTGFEPPGLGLELVKSVMTEWLAVWGVEMEFGIATSWACLLKMLSYCSFICAYQPA
jgi:hypothetical protein